MNTIYMEIVDCKSRKTCNKVLFAEDSTTRVVLSLSNVLHALSIMCAFTTGLPTQLPIAMIRMHTLLSCATYPCQ